MSFGYRVGVSNRFDILLDGAGVKEAEKPKKQNDKKAPVEKKVEQKTESVKKPEQPKNAQKAPAKTEEKPKAVAEKPKGSRSDNNRGGFRGEGRPRDGESREGRSDRGGRGRGEHRGPREQREGQVGDRAERGEGRGGRGRSDRGRGGGAGGDREHREPREQRGDREHRERTERVPRTGQTEEKRDPLAPSTSLEETRPNRRERRDKEKLERKEEEVTEEKGFVKPKERLYERRSGTGRPANEFKKRGAGRGNWGKPGSELEVEEEQPAEATETPTEPKPTEPEKDSGLSAEEAAKEEERRKQEEEDAKKISYQEFLKIQQSNLAEVPLRKPLRRAGEGDETEKWADYSPLKKEDDQDSKVQSKKKEKKLNPKAQKVPIEQVLDVKVNVDSPLRSQRTRNPKKRTEPAAKKDSPTTPVLNDDKLFPSLSPAVKA